jgi:hypothetical protein
MLSTAPITAPSFDETSGICAIVAVVDTRRVLRARETTARGVYRLHCDLPTLMNQLDTNPYQSSGRVGAAEYNSNRVREGEFCRINSEEDLKHPNKYRNSKSPCISNFVGQILRLGDMKSSKCFYL